MRAALVRYSSNKNVLRAVSGVALEALKNPPPAAIYQEALRFFTFDSQMASFVRELAQSAAGNAANTLNQAVPPGTDTAPLTNLAMQLAGGNTQTAGPEPSVPDLASLDSQYLIPTRCVSGASAYRQKVISAIISYANANPGIMTPDDACYPPYRVVRGGENAYAAGVVGILTGWGYSSCQLPWAGDVIAVKRTAAFHEEYDFLTSNNCARAFGADTCRPAGF